MVKKNFKMASWSFALSILTLLILATTVLLANTRLGENMNFFTNKNLQSDLEKSYLEIEKLISEKELLMLQLEEQLEKYKALEMENENLQTELELRNQQMDALIQKIDSLEKDVSKLMSLKDELAKAKTAYETHVTEVKNEKTPKKVTSDNVSNNETKTMIAEARFLPSENQKNTSPVSTIIRDDYDELRLLNSSVQTYHIKNSGEKKLASQADKVNSLVLEYTIYLDKNKLRRSNTFYIQLFDTNNKNVGKTKSVFVGSNELIYSFSSTVSYEEEVNRIHEEFSTEGLELDKGVYFLNIFSEAGKLLSSRSFKLD
ncbi:hypothetical protein GOQ30_15315 [Flavobacterium sp. TP390]|uniref:Uncharacterized protein n=1 Tax=Flavobacterium profundi TaxID=1774945 RepID=A0A6I4IUH0_9FLAO|nr:hypothetical protein [Flavobacterium profundi]MVO10542.1 hypothetical protein [Flavobacterium profundi]